MISVNSYSQSPETVPSQISFQREECCWYVAGANPPIKANEGYEVTLECRPKDWLSESEPITTLIVTRELLPQILTDRRTQRWLKFQELVEDWKRERESRSSITSTATIQPYQKIIGMGADALPFIIAQLKSEGDEPDQWFWALKMITGENPVRAEDQGNFKKMAQAWIEWAERQADAW